MGALRFLADVVAVVYALGVALFAAVYLFGPHPFGRNPWWYSLWSALRWPPKVMDEWRAFRASMRAAREGASVDVARAVGMEAVRLQNMKAMRKCAPDAHQWVTLDTFGTVCARCSRRPEEIHK